LSGRETSRSQEVLAFKACLEQASGLPVTLVDERFTTNLARACLSETHRRVSARRHPVDTVAATILLEDYLERLRTADATDTTP
jgi:putative Holliday junction resolvase